MSKGNRITAFIKEHKTMFIVISVVMLLLEIEIFAVAAMKSGRKSTLQVLNTQGNVIFETEGDHLSHFNKYYFEKAAYFLKWPFPILLIILSFAALKRQQQHRPDKP